MKRADPRARPLGRPRVGPHIRLPWTQFEFERLTKRYGDVLAVDAIDFVVPAGATVGLLGGNGAGKTTTLAMLLGLLIPTAGSIPVLGHDMARDRFAALARMNFSSPFVSLPNAADSGAEPAGLWAPLRRPQARAANRRAGRGARLDRIPAPRRPASSRPGRRPGWRWPRR